jgi:N-acyl-D-amino-acid deacylase
MEGFRYYRTFFSSNHLEKPYVRMPRVTSVIELDFEFIIKNGRVIDGTGNPWFKADIGISEGKIAKVSSVPLKEGGRVIDAKGLLVCPGFINLHSHSDSTILSQNNAENCLAMGLVTELTGQCGSSAAPITEGYREAVKSRMRGRTFGIDLEEVDWLTLDEWMRRLEGKGIGINVAPLVGHGTVRSCVMGVEGEGGERVVPTDDEMEGMKAMVEGAMKDGAFGFSTGLTYAPGRNALTGELVELVKAAGMYGGVYASHMRCEGDRLIEATMEFMEICERAGVRGTIAHHKAMRSNNFGKVNETLRMVERARARGVDVIVDQYPWRHGGTTKSLGARFKSTGSGEGPEVGTREELVDKLKDEEEWEKIKAAALKSRERELEGYRTRKKELEEKGGWTSRPFFTDLGGTILSSKSHTELEGKSLSVVAETLGEGDTWEGIRALLIADEGHTSAGAEPYSEEDIVTILRYPWTTVSTDQYAMDNSKLSLQNAADALAMQHPRGWGTYAKILGNYVREERVLTVEEAIRKMTSLPARFLNLQDRGLVKEGFWADLVIFDPETVDSLATYGNPHVFPKGIPYVLVNGEVAIEEGEPTGALKGKALRMNA